MNLVHMNSFHFLTPHSFVKDECSKYLGHKPHTALCPTSNQPVGSRFYKEASFLYLTFPFHCDSHHSKSCHSHSDWYQYNSVTDHSTFSSATISFLNLQTCLKKIGLIMPLGLSKTFNQNYCVSAHNQLVKQLTDKNEIIWLFPDFHTRLKMR